MDEEKKQFLKDIEKARNEGTLHVFYEKYAGKYDQIMNTTGYQDILQCTASLLKSFITIDHPVILDVGCGTGLSGVHLNKVGFQDIHGTDPSANSLRESETKGVYSKVFQGMITETDILDCSDNTFDGVFCIGTITKGHLKLRPALDEFFRVTKPGGYLVFTIRNDKLDQVDMMAAMGEAMNSGRLELVSVENRQYFVDAFCI